MKKMIFLFLLVSFGFSFECPIPPKKAVKFDAKSLFANFSETAKKTEDEKINNIKKSIDPKRFKEQIKNGKKIDPKRFNENDDIFFNYIKTNKNFLELQKSCEYGKVFSFCYHVENEKVFFVFDKKRNKHIFYDEKRAEKILFKESGKKHNFLNGLSENKANIEMPCKGNN